MKRVLVFLFALLLALTPLAVGHSSKAEWSIILTVDNQTPFVYPEAFNPHRPNPQNLLNHCLFYELPYSTFASHYGNTPIRHFSTDGQETWYTVIPVKDYQLLYLFLTPDGNGDYTIEPYSTSLTTVRDSSNMEKRRIVYPQDLPSVILGDKLSSRFLQEGYSREELTRQTESYWQSYYHYCSATKLDPLIDIYSKHPETECYYRCLQIVSFDIIKDNCAWTGIYNYDIILRQDGTGILHYRHFLYDGSPYFPTKDTEKSWELTVAEASAFRQVVADADFESIPTWSPIPYIVFDGAPIYIYGNRESHLIYSNDYREEDGIYRIYNALRKLSYDKQNH